MKVCLSKLFTPWCLAALSLLVITGCGSDSNPVSSTSAASNQVTSVNSKVPSNVYSAILTGAEEVPAVNSAATGTGVVVVDPTTLTMKATIVAADISATAADMQVGARGGSGPVVFTLTESSTGSGIWSVTATLTTDQLTELRSGNYYFNVHSAAFPEGEIRGQITASLPKSGIPIDTGALLTSTGATGVNAATAGTTSTTPASDRPVFYTNVLSGLLVVPPTSSNATGTAITLFRSRDNALISVIITDGMTGTGASLRQATPAAVGPVVSALAELTPGSGIWTSQVTLTTAQVTALNAGNLYYEVTSTAFPAGELRGQVVTTSGTTTATTTTTGTTTGTTAAPASTTSTAMTGVTTATSLPTTATGTGTTDNNSSSVSTGATTVTPTSTITDTSTATPLSTAL